MAAMTKKAWKDMFREIGLTEDDMNNWHRIFEDKHPESHQDFLRWLNLDAVEIQKIRKSVKQ